MRSNNAQRSPQLRCTLWLIDMGRTTLKKLRLFAAVLVSLAPAWPAAAGGDDSTGGTFEPIVAEAMIEACWKRNEALFANIYSIREGTLRTALCLEDQIVEQLAALVPSENLTRQEAAEDLEAIRMAYGSLIWKIHNEHKRCDFRTCGLYDQSLHVSALVEIMAGLLREVVNQRNRFEL